MLLRINTCEKVCELTVDHECSIESVNKGVNRVFGVLLVTARRNAAAGSSDACRKPKFFSVFVGDEARTQRSIRREQDIDDGRQECSSDHIRRM